MLIPNPNVDCIDFASDTYTVLQAMSAYGYEIVQTLIVDIEPDERVKRAMNEINAGKILMSCLLF